MHAPPKPDVEIATLDDLVEADGLIFGFGTRFGTMPAQFKAFLDSTGGVSPHCVAPRLAYRETDFFFFSSFF